jgi:flagellar basal body P-ring formation protein FlgA
VNRRASKFRRIAALVLAGAAVNIRAADLPEAYEPAQHIEALARAQAERHLPSLGPHQHLQVGPLDGRLRLAVCGGEPTTRIGPGIKLADRVLVEITCDLGASWRTFVPVRIIGTASAVVSARVIPAGRTVEAQDLKLIDADQSQLPLGYFGDAALAVGLTATRAIGSGMVLSAPQFTSARSIVRGQEVTLVASTGGIDIRMAGHALSDGYVNQRVKVRNTSSGKIVEGVARSDRVVEVALQ